MKYFNIDARIDQAMINRFFEFANANADDEWRISLWTVGGLTVMGRTVLHIINSRPEKVTLICCAAYSAGFEIFAQAKCKRVITHESKAMMHQSAADLYMQQSGDIRDPEHRCIKRGWKEDGMVPKYLKKLLTKELGRVRRGWDVYFTTKRLRAMFPDAAFV